MLGPILGPRNIVVDTSNKNPCLRGINIVEERYKWINK